MTNGIESNESDLNTSNLLRMSFRELSKGMHTMLPGVIDGFDSDTQRAKVSLATAQEKVDGSKLSFPVLVEVPVQFFRWGGFSITAPVKRGDECCVLFSERSMSLFLQNGGTDRIPNSSRFFDLSDAFAIPGLNSAPGLVSNYDPDNLVIKQDEDKGSITITPDGDITLTSGPLSQTSITMAADGNITIQSGGPIGNTLVVNPDGTISSTNTTAELIDVIYTMMNLINANTVQPGWQPTPKAQYAAELTKLLTFRSI